MSLPARRLCEDMAQGGKRLLVDYARQGELRLGSISPFSLLKEMIRSITHPQGIEKILARQVKDVRPKVQPSGGFESHIAQEIVTKHQVVLAVFAESDVAALEIDASIELPGSRCGQALSQGLDPLINGIGLPTMPFQRVVAVGQPSGHLAHSLRLFPPARGRQVKLAGSAMTMLGEPGFQGTLPLTHLVQFGIADHRPCGRTARGNPLRQSIRVFIPEMLRQKGA